MPRWAKRRAVEGVRAKQDRILGQERSGFHQSQLLVYLVLEVNLSKLVKVTSPTVI
jgi:hypothetical protein